MKKSLLIVLLALSSQVFASVIPEAVGLTSLPTVVPTYIVKCFTVGGNNDECSAAMTASTITAPTSTTTALVLLKEDIAQVEPDTYQYLAGEDMSLALADVIEKMREAFPELRNVSDEEVATLMLSSVE